MIYVECIHEGRYVAKKNGWTINDNLSRSVKVFFFVLKKMQCDENRKDEFVYANPVYWVTDVNGNTKIKRWLVDCTIYIWYLYFRRWRSPVKWIALLKAEGPNG